MIQENKKARMKNTMRSLLRLAVEYSAFMLRFPFLLVQSAVGVVGCVAWFSLPTATQRWNNPPL